MSEDTNTDRKNSNPSEPVSIRSEDLPETEGKNSDPSESSLIIPDLTDVPVDNSAEPVDAEIEHVVSEEDVLKEQVNTEDDS